MAKLSRAALGTAAGRLYARQGWEISQTGARPAGGGVYERMGGLDGVKRIQYARRAGYRPGDRSPMTSPFAGLYKDPEAMSQMTMGGRGFSGPRPVMGGGRGGSRVQERGLVPPGGGEQQDLVFDRAAWAQAISAHNKHVQGGATSLGIPDPSKFWKPRNMVTNPNAGTLQQSALDTLYNR